jgi:hypothetical protein
LRELIGPAELLILRDRLEHPDDIGSQHSIDDAGSVRNFHVDRDIVRDEPRGVRGQRRPNKQ